MATLYQYGFIFCVSSVVNACCSGGADLDTIVTAHSMCF